jgi:hypothetical protein
MELVAADLLKHTVELVLRRAFRIIRSVKCTSLSDFSVQTPELWADKARPETSNQSEEEVTTSVTDMQF